MDEHERGFGGRTPRRQLVYPFLELYNQQVPEEEETIDAAQPLINELL